MTLGEKIERFAQAVEAAQRARYERETPGSTQGEQPLHTRLSWGVSVKPAKKYTKVDVGSSGKYMVVNDTGEIFGIKAYGVIHRGHYYGTLDEVHLWDWSGYTARRTGIEV